MEVEASGHGHSIKIVPKLGRIWKGFQDSSLERAYVQFRLDSLRSVRCWASIVLLVMTFALISKIAIECEESCSFVGFKDKGHVVAMACCIFRIPPLLIVGIADSRRCGARLNPITYEAFLCWLAVFSPWLVLLGNFYRISVICNEDPHESWGKDYLFTDSYLLLLLAASSTCSVTVIPRLKKSWPSQLSGLSAFVVFTIMGGTPENLSNSVFNFFLLFSIEVILFMTRRSAEACDRQLVESSWLSTQQLSMVTTSLNNLVDASFELTGEPAIIVAGGSTERLIGLFGRNMIGRPLTEMLSEDPKRLLSFVAHIQRTEGSQKIPLIFHNSSGLSFKADLCGCYVKETKRITASLTQTSQGMTSQCISQEGSACWVSFENETDPETGSETSIDASDQFDEVPTVVVDANSESLTILHCSPSFTALSGPDAVGHGLVDWIAEGEDLMEWLRGCSGDLELSVESASDSQARSLRRECVFGEVSVQTPISLQAGVRHRALCQATFPMVRSQDVRQHSHPVEVKLKMAKTTKLMRNEARKLRRARPWNRSTSLMGIQETPMWAPMSADLDEPDMELVHRWFPIPPGHTRDADQEDAGSVTQEAIKRSL